MEKGNGRNRYKFRANTPLEYYNDAGANKSIEVPTKYLSKPEPIIR